MSQILQYTTVFLMGFVAGVMATDVVRQVQREEAAYVDYCVARFNSAETGTDTLAIIYSDEVCLKEWTSAREGSP